MIFAPPLRAPTLGMVTLISMLALEALAVATAMPTAARELDGLALYAVAFGATLAASALGMTIAGAWSDRSGPGGPVKAGLAVFVAGLCVAGLASDMRMLVAGRAIQGLGAGGLTVGLYVVVGRLYPTALQPKIFAAFSAAWVVPALVGPALSGLVVAHAGWRWVFLGVAVLAVPAAVLLLPALARLPAQPPTTARSRAVPWACGASAALCLLFYGGQQRGMTALAIIVVAAIVLLACAKQLMPPGTLRLARGLPSVIALRGVATSAFFGCEAYLPLLLSRERGFSPPMAGLALSFGALGWCLGSWWQSRDASAARDRFLAGGTALLSCGLAITALAVFPAMPAAVAIAGWAVCASGLGLMYPNLSVLMLSLSPPDRAGANSAALQLGEALSVATTLAATGSVFALLIGHSPPTAYAAAFATTVALGLASMAVARRTRVE